MRLASSTLWACAAMGVVACAKSSPQTSVAPVHLEATAAPTPVGASAPLPAMVPAAGRYVLEFHSSNEHSCSQSFASSSNSGAYTLSLDDNGAATLSLALTQSSSSGPSLGRYRAGGRDFSHTSETQKLEWKGSAQVVDGRTIVKFPASKPTCVVPATRQTPETRCEVSVSEAFACEERSIEVYPPRATGSPPKDEEDPKVAIVGLVCGSWPGIAERPPDAQLSFGIAHGLKFTEHRMGWGMHRKELRMQDEAVSPPK